jgi:hypothetical protein
VSLLASYPLFVTISDMLSDLRVNSIKNRQAFLHKKYLITVLKYQTVLLIYEMLLVLTEDCGGSVNVCLDLCAAQTCVCVCLVTLQTNWYRD